MEEESRMARNVRVSSLLVLNKVSSTAPPSPAQGKLSVPSTARKARSTRDRTDGQDENSFVWGLREHQRWRVQQEYIISPPTMPRAAGTITTNLLYLSLTSTLFQVIAESQIITPATTGPAPSSNHSLHLELFSKRAPPSKRSYYTN
ncbi:hypothetical protein O988_07920 [Pseudogymnoascus sp. VKM F-3808]|nr:hypothetical protein O988_07920 [Pseudogymnoascus sp. VKM F-3808]